MELLGHSLEDLFQAQNKSFSIKTACMVGIQMVDRLEYLHSKKIIHRDIKPDNFCMGRGLKSHIVYILDFGLAKKYWSSSHKCHIPYITGKKLTGTARYASINALSGGEQSRRDDLESVGYILMYFIRGSLPWQGLRVNRKEDRYKKICEKKKQTSSRELCSGFPKQFEYFVEYTRNLQFTEVPDYNYLRDLLKNIIKKSGNTIDFYYDWLPQKPKIDPEDPIYKNNYKIRYNYDCEWLSNFTPYRGEENNNENNNNDYYKNIEDKDTRGKDKKNMNGSMNINGHNRFESNLSTKCVMSESKNNLPFPSMKK